ncbi:MAG: energy-converting hydrogenase A subunit A EhaA [Methanobrevibacter sp.]|nr:energy-converting hydrogenase A subunit A EhaA [Methanobrevibacter sp.]MBO6104504.1 energy-converting hydrogenase A subunit A EhaA [Methanobrevibacter sp.]MBO7212511.1 energy-converting hydrogenase A subunit A EhaA [Methanobrevibacter sp.]MBO7443928.1 energy-converting hydrogenase A subunit A EhaA [Methanobrevibacter sp.]MBO7696820.1 energy-converting hydrogenase A subunit A EhaA [Methanobrevibacter sp.]
MISIGANGFQLFVNYIVAIIVAIVLGLALRLPLLPEKPIRFSWTKSALFPTPIFAIGILAIFYSLNIFWIYDGLVIAILVGLASALFVKYLFDYVFPNPPQIEGGSK